MDPKSLDMTAKMLIQDKLISETDAITFQIAANEAKQSFISYIVKNKKVGSLDLALYLSKKHHYPYFDLDFFDLNNISAKVDPKFLLQMRVLPLSKKGKIFYAAIADPSVEAAASDLKFQLQAGSISFIMVEEDKLEKTLLDYFKKNDTSLSSNGLDLGDQADLLADIDHDDVESKNDDAGADVDDAPVVKFLQKVLLDAIQQGASDIHFEPYEKFYRIRLRKDGVLSQYTEIPLAIKDKLASRVKVVSKLDISEKRIPQDGRMKLKLSPTRAIDFRVSTLPTLFGEKIVMRILDPSSATLGIEALGYEPEQKTNLLNAVSRPYGMVLVTGPTGSGKTVSLYTCLNILNDPAVNISTAEDPAEINLPGINQVNVNDKAGLTFSAALKSFLRQDPDIIMVGEIRDLETADIAMKAALTGHMVLSTLHTNDAPATLTRLIDMGVAPFNIASAIILITAQRLARRLCKNCKKIQLFPANVLKDAGFTDEDLIGYGSEWNTYVPVGCDSCNNGYKGRVGIYQVMPITDEMREVILAKGTSMQIAAIAKKNGVKDLRQSGLIKVKQGATSIAEVLACTNE